MNGAPRRRRAADDNGSTRLDDLGRIELTPGDNLGPALATLKRQLERAGLFAELKRQEAYLSAGQRRRLKGRRALARLRKKAGRDAESLAR
ncbi:MAG: 30S ribosomal protein S21 [Candidatus Rokubacteria bacterium]|nr:30S ribosomal protein S21 [Candidatus Rokubacteria bacterium]